MSGRKWPWRALLGVAVSAAVLAAVFAMTDLHTLWAALRSVPWWVVASATALLALSLVLRAAAWRLLLGKRVSFGEAFWALNVGYLVNNFIPFRAGEAARAFLVAPKAEVGFWHALSTVMVERLVDVLALAGMLVGSLPWVLNLPWARRTSWLFGGGALAVLVALMVIAAYRARLTTWLSRWHPPVAAGGWRVLRRWATAFLDGLEALASPGAFAAVVGLLLLSWGMQVVAYGLTLRALVPDASYLWAAFTLGSVGMGIAVPSAPGGVGVLEGVIVFVLGALGVTTSVALAYALTMHAVYYGVTGLLGWIGSMVYGVSWREVALRSQENNKA